MLSETDRSAQRGMPMKFDAHQLLATGASICVRAAPITALLLCLLPVGVPAADTPPSSPVQTPSSQVQFGGQCAEALAEGRHVMTKCAITWTDKDGKVYCFNSDAAKKSFLENPDANLQKARDFFAASSVESTGQAMQSFDSSDAETLVKGLIEEKTKANNGVFPYEDPLNGAQLKLVFDGIDFTRTIDGYGFFPDVKFHDAADPQKRYLIDFWVHPAPAQAEGAGDPHLQGAVEERRFLDADGTLARAVVVDPGLRAPREDGDRSVAGK